MDDIELTFSETSSSFTLDVGETTNLGITDVKVNGTSVVDEGVANISLSDYVTKTEPLYPRAGGTTNE